MKEVGILNIDGQVGNEGENRSTGESIEGDLK